MPYAPRPRLALNPELVRAARESPIGIIELAWRCGWRTNSGLSTFLGRDRRRIPGTARNIRRLEILASSVAFGGPVFVEDAPTSNAVEESSALESVNA